MRSSRQRQRAILRPSPGQVATLITTVNETEQHVRCNCSGVQLAVNGITDADESSENGTSE